tara:strand:- start:16711 stop:16950 length:240 start_codon:yes stop_codon:yes gene_type:complete
MLSFKQYNSESFVGAMKGALMGPHGPNHNPNKTKKTREILPDRVTISPQAKAMRDIEQRASTSSPSGPASSLSGTKRVR